MPSIFSAILLLRSLGLRGVPDIIRTDQKKNRQDRQFERNLPDQGPNQPGKLLEARLEGNALLARYTSASLEAVYLADNLLRLTWQPGKLPIPYAIARSDWPTCECRFEDSESRPVYRSARLALHLDEQGGWQLCDAAGQALRDELPAEFFTGSNEAVRWTSRARLEQDECLSGLGLHSGGLNLRGRGYSLWNSDPGGYHDATSDPLYLPLPVYLSLRPAGCSLVFFENSTRARFELDSPAAPGLAQASFDGGALRCYLIAGHPEELLERFSELTGRPALPPRWSLGYQQSRWGYKSAEQIRQVVAGFRTHDLPLQAIHLDIDYMDGYRVFTVDHQRFPDLKGLADELHAQGVRLVTIIDPGVKLDPEWALYQSGYAQKAYVFNQDGQPQAGVVWPGRTVFPDFTRPATRTWWGEQYQTLLDQGVDGVWHDMNEPASFAMRGEMTLPLSARHDLDGQGGNHLEGHNLYGFQMNRAAFEGLLRLAPERRPWIVSRSGWVGNARYAWNWTADTGSTWEGLALTLRSLLNMGLAGLPFTGSDIGGFSGNPSPELYLRWLQLAGFSAFMRTHSAIGTAPREPWVFGEPYTSAVRQTLSLRQRLLPYLYSQAYLAARNGWPLMRPLFFHFPAETDLWAREDAFLCGDRLLVAPALAPGLSQRTVRLPEGTWFDFWSDQPFHGPGEIERPIELERFPLLVRSPAVLPLETDGELALHVYCAANELPEGESVPAGFLYLDAGDGSPDRDFLEIEFHLQRQAGRLGLSAKTHGAFACPYSTVRLIPHGFTWQSADLDGQPQPGGSSLTTRLPFQSITLELAASQN